LTAKSRRLELELRYLDSSKVLGSDVLPR